MTAQAILQALHDCGVSIRVDGDYLRLKPADRIPLRLLVEAKAHKPELLRLLAGREPSGSPLTEAERQAAYQEAVREAHGAYRGGPIDWPGVDAAYQRIVSAQTRAELRRGVRQYVNAVAGSHFSGKHC